MSTSTTNQRQWTPGESRESKYPPASAFINVNPKDMLAALKDSGKSKISVAKGVYLGGKSKEMVNKTTGVPFDSKRRFIKTDKDELVTVSSTASLEGIFNAMESRGNLKKGDKIELVYKGQKKITNKFGKDILAHEFGVFKLKGGDPNLSEIEESLNSELDDQDSDL